MKRTNIEAFRCFVLLPCSLICRSTGDHIASCWAYNQPKKKKNGSATRKADTVNMIRNISQHIVFLAGEEYLWKK